MKQARLGRIAPSTGVATGLMAPLVLGAPGNLDPGFADHGRQVLYSQPWSQAWAVEALDDGGVLVAGGPTFGECSSYALYDCDFSFASELTADGAPDATYASEKLRDVEARDAIRQPDGRVVMVGRQYTPDTNTLIVYRLETSGALDTSFGTQGIFLLPSDVYGNRHLANSVVLDPDGRIAVSGASGEHLIVLRLLADGTLDASFGEGGVFTGPPQDYEARSFIERAAAGYRISSTGASQCQIVGLTAGGALDGTFGAAGVAPVQTTLGQAMACSAMASQADGSLLLAGTANAQPFVTRMLATGASDPAFSADVVADVVTEATAIAVDDAGRALVAGSGEPGALVMRLDAGGSLDTSFGEAGTTIIDLPSDYGSRPRINALDLGTDGSLIAAGGELNFSVPFVVRLHGDGGGDSPGVLSVVQSAVDLAEGEDRIVKVRRTGGKSGAVSVAYSTVVQGSGFFQFPATPGDDYDEVAGTLAWADGDASDREIVVPTHADGGPEEYEGFRVELRDPQGGAGLGTKNALTYVLADGAPAGQFSIETLKPSLYEPGVAEVLVSRNYYFEGAVSVTLTPVFGSASGDDIDATPITLNWADQDSEGKFIQIPIVDDDIKESPESFTVELSNPTGGAILGPRAAVEFTIRENDDSQGGGGGSTGWLSLLLLGLAELVRRSRVLRLAPLRPRARR